MYVHTCVQGILPGGARSVSEKFDTSSNRNQGGLYCSQQEGCILSVSGVATPHLVSTHSPKIGKNWLFYLDTPLWCIRGVVSIHIYFVMVMDTPPFCTPLMWMY